MEPTERPEEFSQENPSLCLFVLYRKINFPLVFSLKSLFKISFDSSTLQYQEFSFS